MVNSYFGTIKQDSHIYIIAAEILFSILSSLGISSRQNGDNSVMESHSFVRKGDNITWLDGTPRR